MSLTSAKIKKLDISNNRGLTELKITKTPVRTLKLNKSIKSLHLENVPVKQLKLSKKMKSLKLENVPLKELRINQSMEALNLDKVPVTNLFLNKKVKKVQLSDVPITKLEIPNDVEKLLLSAVKIRNLKLFNMKKLDDLWLTANGKLEMLIIENCEKLRKLHISSLFGLKQLKIKQLNGLDSLTFWDMPAIPFVEFNGIENISELELYASDSKGIPFYEMKKVKKVQFTPCPGQCIPKEILSMPGVVELDVIEETVTKVLDLDEMINLKILRWEEGVLENIKLTDKSKITYMLLNKNNLSGDWDMSEYTSLSDFSCSDNHISTINLGERNGLDGLSCVNNDLKRLDAYNAMDIYCLSATGNPSLEAFLPRKAYGDGYHSFDKTAKVHYNPASKPLYKYLYAG